MKDLARALILIAAFVFGGTFACKTTPTSPDSFYQVVVTCTMGNPTNPAAEAAVMNCLTNAVGGNYAVCLNGIVAGGMWTVNEVACIVESYVTTASKKLNLGTATDTEALALKNANAWISSEKIGFKN
jgi:hypothetical protein